MLITIAIKENRVSEKPTLEETALWQRRLASQANNRAWSLAESLSRTPEEDEEMLQASHAAMHFWKIIGTDKNRAHAALLVSHAYALLGLAGPAEYYQSTWQPLLGPGKADPWEIALARAVAANVAAAKGDAKAHRAHYAEAFALVAELPDPEDRSILEATLRVLPKPKEPSGPATPTRPAAMNYSMTVTSVEEESLRDAFLTPLRAYNQSKAGVSNYEPLLVVLRDESGAPKGGAWGYTAYGWLFIQQLVVPEEARGIGLGSKVMAMAEATAIERGCHDVWLDTHEFQAKGFYEKLGYTLFGQLPNYPTPFSRFFFRKALVAPLPG